MDNSATAYLKLIADYNANLDKYEQRRPKTGSLTAFLDDTQLIGGGVGIIAQDEYNRVARAGFSPNGTAIPVIDFQGISVTQGGLTTCTASTVAGDTALVDVSYQKISFDLKMPKKTGDEDFNYVKLGSSMQRALMARRDAVLNYLNQLCLTQLESEKNLVLTDALLGFWSDGGGAFEVATAKQNDFFNYLRMSMAQMNFEGNYKFIGNASAFASLVNPQFAQGTGNSVNLGYNFGRETAPIQGTNVMGADFSWYLDTQLVNEVGVLATGFAVPTGSLAIISSPDRELFPQSGVGRAGNNELSTVSLPGLEGIDFGLKYVSDCEANGRDGGLIGLYDSWQFETSIALITPYNSDPALRAGAINKYQVVS